MSEFRVVRPDRFPPIVKNLMIINVLVFVAQSVLDSQYAVTRHLELWPIMPGELKPYLQMMFDMKKLDLEPQSFQPYQIFTHMFAHAPAPQFYHILFNMFTLWMFGRVLENVWGAKRFLIFYIACGLGAAILHLGMQYYRCELLLEAFQHQNVAGVDANIAGIVPALGASGAIMGVMAAFAYLFPNTELYIMLIPIPIKAKWAMLGLAAIDLFGGVANIAGDNLAHFAHLGGAITGFIIVLIWNKTSRKTFY